MNVTDINKPLLIILLVLAAIATSITWDEFNKLKVKHENEIATLQNQLAIKQICSMTFTFQNGNQELFRVGYKQIIEMNFFPTNLPTKVKIENRFVESLTTTNK